MGLGINAKGQPGNDSQGRIGQVIGQRICRSSPIGGGGPGSDDGNRWHAEQFQPATHIENRRGIGQFLEQGRIAWVLERDGCSPCGSQARKLPFAPSHSFDSCQES